MKTTWQFSPRTEALRIIHTAHNIANGFYRLNGFIVLPYDTKIISDQIVLLPNLPYLSIPRFWDHCSRIDIKSTPSIKMTVPEDLITSTQKLLESSQIPTPNLDLLKIAWQKNSAKIRAEIYRLIPHLKNTIKSVNIWPTNFGTGGSFNVVNKPPHNITIWLRQDQNLSALVECLLTSLTRKDVYDNLSGTWSESEIIVDWLLTYSPLSKLLPPISQTLNATRTKQKATLIQQSEKFLQKIGAPPISPTQHKISNLTSAEKKLFDLLKSRSPNVVTFDELADPNNFSLYAISKSIQRLRDKLEASGISGSFIQTKRGEGYLLTN